jgi:uncharacterized protein with gpF-like domain
VTVQFPEDPLTNVITWQTQLKKHSNQQKITKMKTPEITKESHEKLHTVLNATDHIEDWRTFWKDILKEEEDVIEVLEKNDSVVLRQTKQRIINHFLDTIAHALEELSGKEVLDCFIQAVEDEHTYKVKESNKVGELFNLLSQLK